MSVLFLLFLAVDFLPADRHAAQQIHFSFHSYPAGARRRGRAAKSGGRGDWRREELTSFGTLRLTLDHSTTIHFTSHPHLLDLSSSSSMSNSQTNAHSSHSASSTSTEQPGRQVNAQAAAALPKQETILVSGEAGDSVTVQSQLASSHLPGDVSSKSNIGQVVSKQEAPVMSVREQRWRCIFLTHFLCCCCISPTILDH
jgi:hypothetical protein